MILYTDKHRIPFQIDEEDYEAVRRYSWSIYGPGYLTTTVGRRPHRRLVHLHVFLMGRAPEGTVWDHENRDKFDNRRSNLRPVAHSINQYNTGLDSNNTSGVKGVSWSKSGGRWEAYIKIDGRKKHLGRFDTLARSRRSAGRRRILLRPPIADTGAERGRIVTVADSTLQACVEDSDLLASSQRELGGAEPGAVNCGPFIPRNNNHDAPGVLPPDATRTDAVAHRRTRLDVRNPGGCVPRAQRGQGTAVRGQRSVEAHALRSQEGAVLRTRGRGELQAADAGEPTAAHGFDVACTRGSEALVADVYVFAPFRMERGAGRTEG